MAQDDKARLAALLRDMSEGRMIEPSPDSDGWPPSQTTEETAESVPRIVTDVVPTVVAPIVMRSGSDGHRALRRTMIPPLLTTGVLCWGILLVGRLSGADSPFAIFLERWFALPAALLGILLPGLAGLLMAQVRIEEKRQ